MDCSKSQDALDALRGGRVADDTTSAAAQHAASCPECTAYSRALAALEAIPPAAAPRDLADRIALAVDAEAARTLDAPAKAETVLAAATPATARQTDHGVPPWLTRTRLWTATGVVTLAAAAVVVAVALNGADQTALTEGVKQALRDDGVGSASSAAPPLAGAPNAGASVAPTSVPDYIAFDSYAYRAGSAVEIAPSQLTTAGTALTALDGGSVLRLTVYRESATARDIVVALPSGERRRFSPVTREYGARTYQLRPGPTLDRFGTWPTLPEGYTQPPNANGSPYYRVGGTDTLGVRVYVRIGETPDLGFGIAPGTPATDPAAGNPHWTWWSPTP